MKTLDDIEKLLGAMRDRGAEMKAFEGLLGEISTSLADIVSLLEMPRAAPAAPPAAPPPPPPVAQVAHEAQAVIAKALIEGLAKVRITAPAVTVEGAKGNDWTSLQVKVGKAAFDGSKEYTITKV